MVRPPCLNMSCDHNLVTELLLRLWLLGFAEELPAHWQPANWDAALTALCSSVAQSD